MANVVEEIQEDILFRLGDPAGDNYRKPVVLRAMNRVYKQINSEDKTRGLVSRETTFTFSASDITNEINYKTLPTDWLKPYRINPKRDWREPAVFRNDEQYTYTADLSQITISSVSEATTTFTVRYFSSGWTLVNKEDADLAASGEVNTPEWPLFLHQLLLKATCLELNLEYPQAKQDMLDVKMLKSAAFSYVWSRQATDPVLSGPNRDISALTRNAYSTEGY